MDQKNAISIIQVLQTVLINVHSQHVVMEKLNMEKNVTMDELMMEMDVLQNVKLNDLMNVL